MADREGLIQVGSIGGLLEEIETAVPVDRLTFYAHDLLSASLPSLERSSGHQEVAERLALQTVVMGGKGYVLEVKETGLPYRAQDYKQIMLERRPARQPHRGKFVVDTARWSVAGEPERQWVGCRTDKNDWLGRTLKGRGHEISYPNVVTENVWVKQALLEALKLKRGGFDG